MTSCGGCDLIIAKMLASLGLEPVYFKMIVEDVAEPREIDTLIVTGVVMRECDEERLKRWASRARRVIMAGCCAVNGGLLATKIGAVPPSRFVPGAFRAPGCPVIPEILASVIRRCEETDGV